MIRMVRLHACPCGFWNEMPIAGLRDEDAPDPPSAKFQIEPCPKCDSLVPLSKVLRLKARSLASYNAAPVDSAVAAGG